MSVQQARVDQLFGQLSEALSPTVVREKVAFSLARVREQYVPAHLAPSSADELRAEASRFLEFVWLSLYAPPYQGRWESSNLFRGE